MDSPLNSLPAAVRTVRDLTVIPVDDQHLIVVAVDSDGGIGELPHDTVSCSAYQLGRFAIRVPLMEVLCSGATPVAAFDMLTVPMNEYGKEILRGIRSELAAAGLPDDFPLSGSTEDNVPTTMTGVGTMIIGIVQNTDFKPGKALEGARIFTIGLPKSAPADQVTVSDPQIVQQSHVLTLNGIDQVHDMLPVGSKGIGWEATQLAAAAGLKAELIEPPPLDLKKSAGPNTCLLAAVHAEAENLLRKQINVPVTLIGKVIS